MGFASVAGARGDGDRGRPEPARREPAVGHAPHRDRRLPLRAALRGRRRNRGHARGRVPDRRPQRLLHRPLQDAGLHGDAGLADAVRRGRDLAHPVAEHRQPAAGLPPPRLGRPRLVLFRREGRSDDQAARHPFLRHLSDGDRTDARPGRRDHAAEDRVRPPDLCGRDESPRRRRSRAFRSAASSSSSSRFPASARRSRQSSIRPASAAAGRRSDRARRFSTSSARR